MRQKRAKAYKKQMGVYVHTFKFREPFQTIVDDELILTCIKSSFNLTKGLDRTIQSESKPMITQCCMQALYATNNQAAIDLGKSFERRRCNHPPRDPKPPSECIASITNIEGQNKHRYVVASQSVELRKQLRQVPGVPLIFMNRSVMVMEPLSHASSKFAEEVELRKLTGGLNNALTAGYINKDDEPENEGEDQPRKKRKGPKGPNPLSIKKKKSDTPAKEDKSEQPKKRRRKHHKKSNGGNENPSNENEGSSNHEHEGSSPNEKDVNSE